jgi:Uma2 family endonuclease
MIAPTRLTYSDLDDSERLYEEIDGLLVEAPPMSFYANIMAGRLHTKLDNFSSSNELGFSAIECLFQMGAPINRNRRPDVAFVSWKRWPRTKPFPMTDNALDVVPNLLVEFVSPSDLAEETLQKMEEYFTAGAEQVWLVYPTLSRMQIFDNPTSSRWLAREDVLKDLPYLPGFQLPLCELFVENA